MGELFESADRFELNGEPMQLVLNFGPSNLKDANMSDENDKKKRKILLLKKMAEMSPLSLYVIRTACKNQEFHAWKVHGNWVAFEDDFLAWLTKPQGNVERFHKTG